MEWQPATIDDVKAIVRKDLGKCNAAQIEAFLRFAVEPYTAQLLRYGKPENAVVIARKDAEAMYWEDVEEGFNISRVGSDGSLLDHRCNQDDLSLALQHWA